MTSAAVRPAPPGLPPGWAGAVELERLEWRVGEGPLRPALEALLDAHGCGGPLAGKAGAVDPERGVVLLLGAAACAELAGFPPGPRSPAPQVPDAVAIAVRAGPAPAPAPAPAGCGAWRRTWSDAEHAAAVAAVRAAIARGDVYQGNVVGHRRAAHRSSPRALAERITAVGGGHLGAYRGVVSGDGWAVGSASPEQLVRVTGSRITTVPVKGTLPVGPGAEEALRASAKDRAEHVMIVDLERNDLSRIARTGTVEVESLYALEQWAGLWHAGSRVAAELRDDVTVLDVLAATAPGGSVTGAPKQAAWELLASLEPVGRGPSMGAAGCVWAGGMDLGLTIRTAAVTEDEVHLWAGGGVTWGSSPAAEVAEAHAKAGPLATALSR